MVISSAYEVTASEFPRYSIINSPRPGCGWSEMTVEAFLTRPYFQNCSSGGQNRVWINLMSQVGLLKKWKVPCLKKDIVFLLSNFFFGIKCYKSFSKCTCVAMWTWSMFWLNDEWLPVTCFTLLWGTTGLSPWPHRLPVIHLESRCPFIIKLCKLVCWSNQSDSPSLILDCITTAKCKCLIFMPMTVLF